MPDKKVTKSAFKLTAKNYFSKERPHISASMLKDYLRSREYFAKKHVLHSLETKPTPSLKIGSVVDAILSKEPQQYQVSVLKRDNPTLYEMQKTWPEDKLISQGDMDKAKAMAQAVAKCEFWKPNPKIKKILQPILESAFENMQLCGKLDVLEIIERENEFFMRVSDIKTTQPANMKNAFTWHRTCEDWGYYLQMAMYRKLVLDNMHLLCPNWIPGKKLTLEFGFIAVSIDRDMVTQVKLFKIPESTLDAPLALIFETLGNIKAQNFTDAEPSWETALELNPDPIAALKREAVEVSAQDDTQEENDYESAN